MNSRNREKKRKPKRYKQYRLRMSESEDARLKRLSEETGMSCADVMRDALDKYTGLTNCYEDDLK